MDGVDFIAEFSDELKKYSSRLAASENETACARAIRNRLHDETDAKTRLEAFKARPLSGRGSLLLLGVWYAVCYALYFVSFAGSRLTGILLTLLSLALFLAGGSVLLLCYLGNSKTSRLLPGKVSYNVVSEFAKDDNNVKRTFVIVDNHDAMQGSPIKDFELVQKLAPIIAPASVFIFVLFCILKASIGTQGENVAAKISAFTIFPFISGIFGIASFVLHYSPFEKYSRATNGVSTATAMATYAYFVENPDLLPDDTKLVYVSLGAENCGRCGSKAFVAAHPELAGATVLCVGDVNGEDIGVAEYDAIRRLAFSTDVVSSVHASAREQGIAIRTLEHDSILRKLDSVQGYTSNAFSQNGNPSASVISQTHRSGQIERADMENMFALLVGSMQKLMEKQWSEPSHDAIAPAPSAEMEIVDIESK